ncbi:MAG: hypothetical protein IKL84_01660, partial [Clostridia bacterium]|nr:hypothetical protein [Clostridia bacterium]
ITSHDYQYAHVIWKGVVYRRITGIYAPPDPNALAVVGFDSESADEFDPGLTASNCVEVNELIFPAGGLNPAYVIAAYDRDGKMCNFVRTARSGSAGSLDGKTAGEILPDISHVAQVNLFFIDEEYSLLKGRSDIWQPLIKSCLTSVFTDLPLVGTGEPITLECFLGDGLYYSFTLYENGVGRCIGETIRLPEGLYADVLAAYDALPQSIPGTGADGEQMNAPFYGGLFWFSTNLTNLVPREEVDHYIYELFTGSHDNNHRSFCRYFGITEEQYRESLAPKANNPIYSEGGQYQVDHFPAGVYGSYADFINTFVARAFRDDYRTEECIPGPDCPHTFTYHTITDEMMDLVGEEKYAEFREKYYGTEDFNIIHFIACFDLTKEQISRALEESKDPLPAYKVDYLFGDGEMQKEYFFIKSAQTSDTPEALYFSSGGATVIPTMEVAHRMLWTDGAWLSGSGPSAEMAIRKYADTMPTLTIRNRSLITAHLAPGQTVTGVTVLDANYEGGPLTDAQVGHQLENLHRLPADGTPYYVAVHIQRPGRFIESEQLYEYYADYALFRVIVER